MCRPLVREYCAGDVVKKLVFDYEMKLSFSSPVTDHRFQLRCIPATGRASK